MPKSIDHTIEELLDRSSMQTPEKDKHLRRRIEIRCEGCILWLVLREDKANPFDASALVLLDDGGYERPLVRIDTDRMHTMTMIYTNRLVIIRGPHIHVINELVPGKDDWYAFGCDAGSLEDAVKTIIRIFNIDYPTNIKKVERWTSLSRWQRPWRTVSEI